MEYLKKVNSDIIRKDIQDQDFHALLNDFLSDLDVMDNTRATYKRTLIQFYKWVTDNNIIKLSRKTILDYKKYLEGNRTSLTTCTYLIGVRKFFQWAEINGKYKDIAKGIKGARITSHKKHRDFLTVKQEERFLNSIDRSTIQGKRDYALFMILFNNACRCCEVERADIDDIRVEKDKMVLWVQQKRHSEKDTPKVLSLKTYTAIQKYLQARDHLKDSDPLFISHSNRAVNERLTTFSISRLFKIYAEKINIKRPRIVCHSTRHTAINRIIEAGASMDQASAFAGHNNPNSIKPYFEINNRLDDPVEDILVKYKGDELAFV